MAEFKTQEIEWIDHESGAGDVFFYEDLKFELAFNGAQAGWNLYIYLNGVLMDRILFDFQTEAQEYAQTFFDGYLAGAHVYGEQSVQQET